ncbi:MAG: ubiquinone/menaquinone biosynthesis methyltransferase [Dehalococcoidales bacterium]|nr:ubiquinone/menaquinone biosynthesis methyltransferase [Dehalococcoidales bacterium]
MDSVESVKLSHQSEHLHHVFTEVPSRYDLINHVMTFGLDIRWRRLAVKALLEGDPEKVLDLGCGTGDLAITIAKSAKKGVKVTGLDFSPPMLDIAREKAANAGVGDRINLVHGDAGNMPFPNGYLDRVGISFAFRNLTYENPLRERYLGEIVRVLKPGGKFIVVESSQPSNPVIKPLFHIFLNGFVAPVGSLISKNKGAYRYLATSVSNFFTPAEVKQMLLKAGFSGVSYRPLVFGTAGIHVAVK